MLQLEEITQTEETILFDTSISSDRQFIRQTYKIKHPEEIRIEELQKALRIQEEFLRFLTQPNTFTIEEVREEYKAFLEIISERMAFYDYIARKRKQTQSQKNEIYKQLGQIANKNLKKLSKKIYSPVHQQQYQSLQQLINTLEIPIMSDISQTNKNLVATALYATNIDRRQIVIISGNEQIQTLVEKLIQQHNKAIRLYMQRNNTYTLV